MRVSRKSSSGASGRTIWSHPSSFFARESYLLLTMTRPNQRMKLTGAAILVSRGMKVLQAASAAYPYRSPAKAEVSMDETCAICGCQLHRTGEYAQPTVLGRSH